ncbi:ATP-dependent endonuclease [Streptomyces niveus]|uniref:ATP-dependent nuclease n=1 Tax=Streptomyces niveus TaxID=193462 RepID=UPI0034185339
MRISKIVWKNYRRLPDGEILVRDHLVLVGPNDSGKSSVLRAVHMCLGMTRAQLLATVQMRDFTDVDQPLRLEVELTELDDDEIAAFPDEVVVGAEPEVIKIVVMAGLNLAGSDDAEAADETKEVRRFCEGSGHDRGLTKAQFEAISWAYVPAARSLSRELGSAGGTMQYLLSSLDLGADAVGVAAAAGALREQVKGSASVQQFGAELARTLTEALPRAVNPEAVHISAASDLGGSPLAGMTVAIEDGEHLALLSEQSDGVRALSVLALLGMSQRSARIVGVDEPEIHLHTSAQRAVARGFRKSAGQRLVVSHSAALVGQMDAMDIVAFGADRQPRQLPANAFEAGSAQAAKYWIPSIIDSLTSRKLLFVEGPSDRMLCEKVAELIGLEFDRIGVTIVELGSGNSFTTAYRILGPEGFNLPIFGITDEDKRIDWAKAVGIDANDLESRGYMVCDPDLEGMYAIALGRSRMLELIASSADLHEGALMRSSGVQTIHDISIEHLAAFCGKKRKVQAAVAVSSRLTYVEAESMRDLCHFLRMVAS